MTPLSIVIANPARLGRCPRRGIHRRRHSGEITDGEEDRESVKTTV
ncbi:hypothetical protein [Streptomyces sp. NPDC002788]